MELGTLRQPGQCPPLEGVGPPHLFPASPEEAPEWEEDGPSLLLSAEGALGGLAFLLGSWI